MNDSVVLNTDTVERGAMAEWVRRFEQVWRKGQDELENMLRLLSPSVQLSAPGLPAARGRDAARRVFRLSFRALPRLHARVNAWSASRDLLFVDMTFSTELSTGHFEWPNIDRFRFEQGVAVERVAFHDPTPVQAALREATTDSHRNATRPEHNAGNLFPACGTESNPSR
ncbi:MAG: nuclear transport factor 2 family protein [Spirochaetales bacterium]|nr:nuclear transport factor 2 family protein [Leptospiraceae bacterium]MCP5481168.1 nuclear transport factor 2 family protein [Spirochaetales bacterium]